MPKREPKFENYPGDLGTKYVAVGAAHPSEPVQGTISGQNHDGYDEPVLVFPGGLSPEAIETLRLSQVATFALRLRDNLLARPCRLNRVGGPLQAKEVTWVLCEVDGFFFKPLVAQIGSEPVSPDLVKAIWEGIEST